MLEDVVRALGLSGVDRTYLDGLYPRRPYEEIFVNVPGLIGPFLYDAVVAIGLALCGLLDANGGDGKYNITGKDLFAAILGTSFNGSPGSVVFDPVTGTRDPSSAMFSLTNFVDDEAADVGSDMIQFKGKETDLFKSGYWISL
jgi:hypothetical protein